MNSKSAKSAKSAGKASQPRSNHQADIESSRPGRERRPSDKITAQRQFFLSIFIQNLIDLLVLEQQEADLLKAQKEARRALRKKKELQKANQMANLPSDGEGEYLPRPIPTVSSMFFFVST
jgi:hypothetical protein